MTARMQRFEKAVLALAALICPEHIPCDRCLTVASQRLHDDY